MKICIVEDNQALLTNLRLLLEGESGFVIIGAFPTAEEALEADPWDDCDCLLVDIDLPGISGLDLIRRIHPQHPLLQILVHTISETRETVFSAIKAGAMGYLLKGTSPREMIESLRTLHLGGAPMTPRIARKVILEMQGEKERCSGHRLSSREIEILAGIARGRSYKDLSEQFNLSRHTVHAHVKRVYEKLQASSRGEALERARLLGVI